MTSADKVLQFYHGRIPAYDKFYVNDILSFTEEQFENEHQFIQWLFPITTVSFYNLSAPVLTKADVKKLSGNPFLYKKMAEAFRFVCNRYGFEVEETDSTILVVPKLDFTGYWMTPGNHNYKRITRILTSLNLLGLEEYARALFDCLEMLYWTDPDTVGEKSFAYWKVASHKE